ncbi:MAG: hypothetical protein U9R50_11745 [Campylobacterota bacterium]|nr:hypothetical protein [Campylobacterota bacterium]
MKKITLFAAIVLLSTTLAAQIKPYAGAGFGFMATPDYPGAENGLGLTVKAGATGFVEVMPEIGALFELNKSLTGLNDADVLSLGAYASYDILIPNSAFAIRPKFGVIIPNAGDEIHSRDITFSSGIGGKMALSKQLDLYVDYVVLGEGVTNYSIGAEFKF